MSGTIAEGTGVTDSGSGVSFIITLGKHNLHPWG
jgi:hypothetical protein